MSQEFQGGVCGGNWWTMINSSQNLFRTSPCSSSINGFGWQNHDLVKNLDSSSHENNLQILQEDANYFNSSMNYQQPTKFSTLQNPSYDSFKNQTVFPANHEQRYNPTTSSSSEIAAAYSYNTSMVLQHLFDTDSQEHETLLDNLGLNYTQAMNSPIMGSFEGGQEDYSQFGNNTQYWKDSTAISSCDIGASILPSTQPQFTASFSSTKANKIRNCAANKQHKGEKKATNEQPATLKRSRIETPSPLPTFKVRKEKLGDRITALQQLVSPFGKTDTASVLHEAIDYIKFLHDQVRVLSTPYMKNGSGPVQYQQKADNNNRTDLKSRGLCIVPISSTFPVATETSADFWTPNFGGNFKR